VNIFNTVTVASLNPSCHVYLIELQGVKFVVTYSRSIWFFFQVLWTPPAMNIHNPV